MFEVRKIIEPAAARLAAGRATPEELAEIRAALGAMATAHDEVTYLDADVRYHAMLVAATHNDHLVQLVAAFGPALQAGLQIATRHGWDWPDFLEYSIGPHREVLDAVVDHDADRAGAAMDRLVTQSMVSLDSPAGPGDAPSRPSHPCVIPARTGADSPTRKSGRSRGRPAGPSRRTGPDSRACPPRCGIHVAGGLIALHVHEQIEPPARGVEWDPVTGPDKSASGPPIADSGATLGDDGSEAPCRSSAHR